MIFYWVINHLINESVDLQIYVKTAGMLNYLKLKIDENFEAFVCLEL